MRWLPVALDLNQIPTDPDQDQDSHWIARRLCGSGGWFSLLLLNGIRGVAAGHAKLAVFAGTSSLGGDFLVEKTPQGIPLFLCASDCNGYCRLTALRELYQPAGVFLRVLDL